jgi:Fe-S oxidoreductase
LVDYQDFMRQTRSLAIEVDNRGICTHAGTIQAISHLQKREFVKKNLDWISDDLKVTEQGEVLFFVGCSPYFNVIFNDIGANSLAATISSIKILNAMGIVPAVSPDERCCGHDAYWTGDFKTFKHLAKKNFAMIENSGAKKVVLSCAEGYSTIKSLYPEFFGKLKFQVQHISEFIAEKIETGEMKFKEVAGKFTYHDPCRLGRFESVYDAPRKVLQAIPGLELIEMPRNRENALCCGSSTWINCTQINKKIQVERLKEAQGTGAATMITACPKCKIHLSCTMHDNGFHFDVAIKDLATMVAEALVNKQ